MTRNLSGQIRLDKPYSYLHQQIIDREEGAMADIPGTRMVDDGRTAERIAADGRAWIARAGEIVGAWRGQ